MVESLYFQFELKKKNLSINEGFISQRRGVSVRYVLIYFLKTFIIQYLVEV